jgi:hypothetical protein
LKANQETTYTITEINNALNLKANADIIYNKALLYTKDELNTLLLTKLNITAFNSSLDSYYNKTYINSMIANYYNSIYIDTLIASYYTIDQVNVITNLLKADILNT